MPIDTTNFQTVLTTVANSLTSANTPTQFEQVDKAIDLINNNRLDVYQALNYASLPTANNYTGSFAYSIADSTMYYSDGTIWTVGAVVVDNLTSNSTSTVVSSNSLYNLNNIANTLLYLAEAGVPYGGNQLSMWGVPNYLPTGWTPRYGGNIYTPVIFTGNTLWKSFYIPFNQTSLSFLAGLSFSGDIWFFGNPTTFNSGIPNIYPNPPDSPWVSFSPWCSNQNQNVDNFYAIKQNGTLWGAGHSYYLTLPDGVTPFQNISSPIQIGSLTNWKQISAGFQPYADPVVAAVKTDGTLWVWGVNSYGQLGLGDNSLRSVPVQVGALTNWSSVSVDSNGFCIAAIKTDGTLWAWGYNNYGNLGTGDTNSYSSPVQIGNLTNWLSINIDQQSSSAIKTDGTLWTWGYNTYGELGLGDTTSYSSPVQVGTLTNWKQVTKGWSMLAVKTDGTLWSWGYNSNGQLGLGDTTSYSSPIQVGTNTNWASVSMDINGTVAVALAYPQSTSYSNNITQLINNA